MIWHKVRDSYLCLPIGMEGLNSRTSTLHSKGNCRAYKKRVYFVLSGTLFVHFFHIPLSPNFPAQNFFLFVRSSRNYFKELIPFLTSKNALFEKIVKKPLAPYCSVKNVKLPLPDLLFYSFYNLLYFIYFFFFKFFTSRPARRCP